VTDQGPGAFFTATCGVPLSRRTLLGLAGGAIAGAVLDAVPSAAATPRSEATRIVERYVLRGTRPWGIVHGIRGLNRDYPYGETTAGVHVLSRYLEARAVNGQRVLAFPIDVEAHTNAFLKSFLEAGLPLDLAFSHRGGRATLRDVLDGARRLFRFQPATQEWDDLAWSLIAFVMTTPPSRDSWRNAWGETVRLGDVAEAAFRVAEQASAPVRAAMQHGQRLGERAPIHGFTCGGTHFVYGLIRAVRAGYTEQQHTERLHAQLDMIVWRLVADVELIDDFYRGQPDLALHRTASVLKFTGHAFECLNAAATWGLWEPRPAQRMTLQYGRDRLGAALGDTGRVDVGALIPAQQTLHDRLTGDTCHALHGLGFARQAA